LRFSRNTTPNPYHLAARGHATQRTSVASSLLLSTLAKRAFCTGEGGRGKSTKYIDAAAAQAGALLACLRGAFTSSSRRRSRAWSPPAPGGDTRTRRRHAQQRQRTEAHAATAARVACGNELCVRALEHAPTCWPSPCRTGCRSPASRAASAAQLESDVVWHQSAAKKAVAHNSERTQRVGARVPGRSCSRAARGSPPGARSGA
jgi:hypothetical protein